MATPYAALLPVGAIIDLDRVDAVCDGALDFIGNLTAFVRLHCGNATDLVPLHINGPCPLGSFNTADILLSHEPSLVPGESGAAEPKK